MPDANVGSLDPFTSFRFRVLFETAQYGFQKCTGLKSTSDVLEYREGDKPIIHRKLPGLLKFDPIVLTRGQGLGTEVIEWRYQVAGYGTNGGVSDGVPPDGFRRTIIVQLFSKGDNAAPSMEWTIYKAWPFDLQESELNAESSAVLIEQVSFAHEGMLQTKPKVNVASPA